MKKLDLPLVDDVQLFKDLCGNKLLNNYSHLGLAYFIIKNQYENYLSKGGNPWLCSSINIDPIFNQTMLKLYATPPKTLSYIKTLRKKGSPNVCPMCGSLGTGTLDHYLPKKKNPEWAIFSANLIPACSCNTKRKEVIKGSSTPENILHPYFDDCLINRLITCSFNGSLNLPTINIIQVGTDIKVKFHIDNVVRKSGLQDWLEGMWGKLNLMPADVIFNMQNDQFVMKIDVVTHLIYSRDHYERQLGTPNNWYSIFYDGLINSPSTMHIWIRDKHNSNVFNTLF